MIDQENPFAAALARHEGKGLRRAFAHCNELSSDGGYDRTTLGRWLQGSVPVRAGFVECLAEQLDDPEIHRAWLAASRDDSRSEIRAVVTRFRRLPTELKEEAFRLIRRDFVDSDRGVRTNLTMRIDVGDLDDELLKLRVAIDYDARLPAQAKVVFVSNHEALGDAYELPGCIFRDVIGFDVDRFADAFAPDRILTQSLSYTDLDRPEAGAVTHQATATDIGRYEFDNPEVERARIRLRTTYPYPRGLQLFPIMFGQYRIAGTATISLVLNSRSTSKPIAFGFTGGGSRWDQSQLPDEIVVQAGDPETVLGDGTGVVLSWFES